MEEGICYVTRKDIAGTQIIMEKSYICKLGSFGTVSCAEQGK